jgi:hypothetical protein
MKSIILFAMLFLTQNCNQKTVQVDSQDKLPAPIDYVHFQKWIGGQEQTGSGINFEIKFKTAFSANFVLKKVYFRNQEATFEAQDPTTFIARFSQKPNSDLNLDSNPQKEYGNKVPEIAKFKLQDDEAVLEFHQDNIKGYFKITKIKEKELLAYPATRPKE